MCTNIPLLRFLPPEMRELVAASFEPGSLSAGATIVPEGSPPDALYVVIEGGIAATGASDVGGQSSEAPQATFGPGDAFGRVGSLAGTTCTGTVRASSDVELLRLDEPAFSALLENRPELRQQLELRDRQRRLSDRLRQFTGPVLQTSTRA